MVMELRDGVNKEKLESLLVANWTQFINTSKLMAFVSQTVRENAKQFAISAEKIKTRGNSITLSKCEWQNQVFILWVEFHIPLNNQEVAEGTMELQLSDNGSITHTLSIGNIYIKEN